MNRLKTIPPKMQGIMQGMQRMKRKEKMPNRNKDGIMTAIKRRLGKSL